MQSLLALALVAAVGCDDDSSNRPPPDAPPPPPPVDAAIDAPPVIVTDDIAFSTAGGLGNRLVDKDGKALYFFVNDTATVAVSQCVGACPATWHAFDAGATPRLGTGVVAGDIGRADLGGGRFQTTFRGRLLYRFSGDTAANTAGGEGMVGLWFVARPYNLFFAVETGITPQGGAANTPYLTNGAGRAVYAFTGDTRGAGANQPVNSCTAVADCAVTWPLWAKPAALDIANAIVPSTITKADFSVLTVGAESQFVYKGWPLYFYAPDVGMDGMGRPKPPGTVEGTATANWYVLTSSTWDGALPTFVPPTP